MFHTKYVINIPHCEEQNNKRNVTENNAYHWVIKQKIELVNAKVLLFQRSFANKTITVLGKNMQKSDRCKQSFISNF